jgi:hypothetical protein
VQEVLNANGEIAVIVHSNMSREAQAVDLGLFTDGSVRHLVFVMIVSEGFDHPPIDTVVLMRPTKSPVLYVQSVGRALRIFPGKTDCLVLDYGQVVKNCGPLDDPNIPEKGKKKKIDPLAMKFCPGCYSYMPSSTALCPDCGHDFIAAKLKEQKDRLAALSHRADHEGELLREPEKPRFIEVMRGFTKADRYLSKSGNVCIRIRYEPKNFLEKMIYEYIPIIGSFQSPFVQKKLSKLMPGERASDLEDAINKLNNTHLGNIEAVLTEKEGKYLKVKGYRYVNLYEKINA